MTEPDDRHPVHRVARRFWVGTAGALIVVIGLVLIPLPGPGTLIVIGGLGVLGSEFPSARRLADRIRSSVRSAVDRIGRG